MSGPIAITVFALSLLAAIMLHEWGHFVTARRFGMRADRYFLGFGPTLWSIRRGETEYGVKAIPAGGFVSIRGMTPADERREPLEDTLFDPEALAADRRGQAHRDGPERGSERSGVERGSERSGVERGSERSGVERGSERSGNVLDVPAVPDTTWQRLGRILDERGAPSEVRDRIIDRTRRNADDAATTDEIRPVLHEVVLTETRDTGRIGDLQHRLLKGDEGRFFHDRPAWQRAIVLSAGSAMHFLIAVVVLFAGLLLLPQPTGEPSTVVDVVQDGSAAAEAGLQPGDEVEAVAGTTSDDFEVLRNLIRERPGETTRVTIERGGVERTLEVTPTPTTDEETGETYGLLGFVPRPQTEDLGVVQAARETLVGPSSVPAMAVASVEGLVSVFGPEGLGRLAGQVAGEVERGAEGGMSIVGASDLAGEAVAAFGLMSLLLLIASINVFIGIFNLVPLPPLDGGHLAVLGVERAVNGVRRLRGQPTDYTVDARSIAAIALPVIVMFVVVSAGLIWLDITNPISLQ